MKMKLRQTKNQYLYWIAIALIAIVSLLPVVCNYIMTGGIVSEWIVRTAELSSGLHLFPSTETFLSMWSTENAMDSNLWFFPAGILYRISGNMVLTYRIFMLTLQTSTLFFAKLFFERLFADSETKLPSFYGILLYMTSPYRIFVCYDLADLSAAVVWMIMPLYAWAMLGLLRGDKKWKDVVIASLSLAGVGYAEIIHFLILAGIGVFSAVYFKKIVPLITAAAGTVLLLPALYRIVQYLFLDAYTELGMPLQTIMHKGYRFGQFFSAYVFRDNHPGMGLGLLMCLISGLWIWFVVGEKRAQRQEWVFVFLSVLLALCSWHSFPWDFVQRLGVWALKIVPLINTPAIFAGLAGSCLCVPAAAAVGRISGMGNKLIARAFPVMVLLACLGICFYQCNMLVYNRLPLNIP